MFIKNVVANSQALVLNNKIKISTFFLQKKNNQKTKQKNLGLSSTNELRPHTHMSSANDGQTLNKKNLFLFQEFDSSSYILYLFVRRVSIVRSSTAQHKQPTKH